MFRLIKGDSWIPTGTTLRRRNKDTGRDLDNTKRPLSLEGRFTNANANAGYKRCRRYVLADSDTATTLYRSAGNVCESARGARHTVLADARNYMESIYFIIGFLTAVLWFGALDDCDDY